MSSADFGERGGVALSYHHATKHSPRSVASSRHVLDWSNQPLPYKVYGTLEPIPLPTEAGPSALAALDALRDTAVADGERLPDLAAIARLCILSNGITRIRRVSGGDLAFRAAGTTGALYHVELYLACVELPDLTAGLYHFGAHDNALRRLRDGDLRGWLVEASGRDPVLSSAPLIVVATSTFWRNAWKYEARAWRHTFWDTGTILANLLALATAADLPARVVLAFADPQVNRLLSIEPDREAAVCMVGIGHTNASAPAITEPPAPLDLPTVPLSPHEVRYPLIEQTQAATSLGSPGEARRWREAVAAYVPPRLPPPAGPVFPLTKPPESGLRARPIEGVIRRRGSTRRFASVPIEADELGVIVDCAGAPLPVDFVPGQGALGRTYIIVNAVQGLDPGTYVVRDDGSSIEQLRAGTFRSVAGHLALGQALGADASVDLFLLADVRPLLAELGGRGYRAAQLEASIRMGRAWLAAYALRLGATGLTFFDDEVAGFLAPRMADPAVLTLLAVGRSARPVARERRQTG